MLRAVGPLCHLARAMSQARGAFIVFEGGDKCGKTTQCRKLVEALNNDNIPAKMLVFPDRSTAIGQVISDYLEKKCELEDHAVHLLFAANRWEMMPQMRQILKSGTTLIVDRYSFSGVAFSGAKPTLDLSWCREPERGLLRPDAVFYLTLSPEEAAKRSQFGDERYEETSFQKTVALNYQLLAEANWQTVDASKSIEELHDDLKTRVHKILAAVTDNNIGALWWPKPAAVNGTNGHLSEEPVAKKTQAGHHRN